MAYQHTETGAGSLPDFPVNKVVCVGSTTLITLKRKWVAVSVEPVVFIKPKRRYAISASQVAILKSSVRCIR